MFALVGLLALLITESGLLSSNYNIASQQTFANLHIAELKACEWQMSLHFLLLNHLNEHHEGLSLWFVD